MRQRLSAKRQERKQNSGRDLQDGPARGAARAKGETYEGSSQINEEYDQT